MMPFNEENIDIFFKVYLCSHRYEDGQVGDANINTQEPKVQKEIMRVIGTQIYSS